MAYSSRTSLVLFAMILTGALRSVAVKLFYQLGFTSPFFVTLLYLTGQGLSLVVDCLVRRGRERGGRASGAEPCRRRCHCSKGICIRGGCWHVVDDGEEYSALDVTMGHEDEQHEPVEDGDVPGKKGERSCVELPPRRVSSSSASIDGNGAGTEAEAVKSVSDNNDEEDAATRDSSSDDETNGGVAIESSSAQRMGDGGNSSKEGVVSANGDELQSSSRTGDDGDSDETDAFVENPMDEVQSLKANADGSSRSGSTASSTAFVSNGDGNDGGGDDYDPLHDQDQENGGVCCNGGSTTMDTSMPPPRTKRRRRGSKTGLTTASHHAIQWVHSIPPHLKPAIPGLFNLINSAMRWGSLVYVPASTAEMLISGLELVLSVVAARVVRKRLVSRARWGGVGVVALGLVLVRLAEARGGGGDDGGADGLEEGDGGGDGDGDEMEGGAMAGEDATRSGSKDGRLIGDALIVGQCLMSVVQDMAEELFMHEADYPATLLLGMEGIFGLAFGLPLYLGLAHRFGERPSETWDELRTSPSKAAFVVGLTVLFTATGILNIVATGVTSSMTRNVWKNFRSVVVWALGLVIFYSTGNVALGEEWIVPDSFFVLFGFGVMLSGIVIYYTSDDGSLSSRFTHCFQVFGTDRHNMYVRHLMPK